MKSSNRLSGTFHFVRACLLLPVLLSCQVSAVQEWIDRDGFPEAYRILTSDHLMYPDNVTDWPMKIDSITSL